MKISKLLSPVFAVGLSIFVSAQAFAANKVFWDAQALNGVNRIVKENDSLIDQEVLNEVGKALDLKLKSLQLPFDIAIRNDELQNITGQAFMEMPEQYALIPIVLDDSISKSFYRADNTNFYKYIVRTNISVVLCGYGGSMLDRVNFLYNIPLNGYGVVRSKGLPPTKDQLKAQFIANAQQIINKRFFIPPNIVEFMNPKYGKTKTYQVTKVNVTPQAQVSFSSHQEELNEEIIPYVAASYTSTYAAVHPEYVVLPEKTRGAKWQLAIVKHISNNLTESNIEEETGARPIELELMDYSIQEVKASNRSKDASFFDKFILKVGVRDLTRKKMVQPMKEFQLPNNIIAQAEISLPTFYGYAARQLAKEK